MLDTPRKQFTSYIETRILNGYYCRLPQFAVCSVYSTPGDNFPPNSMLSRSHDLHRQKSPSIQLSVSLAPQVFEKIKFEKNDHGGGVLYNIIYRVINYGTPKTRTAASGKQLASTHTPLRTLTSRCALGVRLAIHRRSPAP